MSHETTSPDERAGTQVLGNFLDAVSTDEAGQRITDWARQNQSRYVCLCNVHSTITSLDDPTLSQALKDCDLVLPDGAPVAWMMRRKGCSTQRRIAGPDLMIDLCRLVEDSDISVYLFGSAPSTLTDLEKNLRSMFPKLNISGALSPRYGDWTDEELQDYIRQINQASTGPSLVFIGLGCPKQEIWMSRHCKEIDGVLLGVGAAFDFHAGSIKRAPQIFQSLGLEWLHRLLSEPGRLWKRYLVTNSRFVFRSLLELVRS